VEKELIEKIAEEVYQRWEAEEYVGNKKLWEIRKRKLSPLWERFIEEESTCKDEGFMPTYFEFLIGDFLSGESKTDMPELVIKGLDQKEILLGGKVDRVDIGPDKVRIIDYKNSSSEQFYGDMLKEENMGVLNFQLPIYLAALKEYMAEKKKEITLLEGTFYLFRKSKRMKSYAVKSTNPYFEEDVKRRMELKVQGRMNLFNQISEIVEGVKSGNYFICPKDCTFCEYTHICRYVSVDIDEGGEQRTS
jgi:ATP-dependent helicase/DNAse subunit B